MATIVSASSSTSSVTATTSSWWLKDPLNPAANVAVNLAAPDFTTTQKDRAGTFDVLGRANAVVVSDGVSGEDAGAVRFLTTTPSDYTALFSLVNAGHVLLLQSPFGQSWYVWVLKRTRQLVRSVAASPWRYTTLDLVTVDAP